MYPLSILPAGDAALLVSLPQAIDPDVNAWCVALAHALRRLPLELRDVVVGFCTVTIYFDPLAVDAEWLEGEIRRCAGGLGPGRVHEGAVLDVPVCYGDEFGPDLPTVAAFGRCSEEEVVALHSSVTYRVYVVGFVPGFAYMASVHRQIAAPRRPQPRTKVPAGSVAIAGAQTGIYPVETPGGWNIIGRTPIVPFDTNRRHPVLFNPGDRVRFLPMKRSEFVAAEQGS